MALAVNSVPRTAHHDIHRALAVHLSSKILASYGAQPVMLDKAGGDMVPLSLNLWSPKENEAAGIIIHRL